MKILVCCVTYNDVDLMPWFLRHYSAFADELWIWDDGSTDGTKNVISCCPIAKLNRWPLASGINEDVFLQFAYDTYPQAAGRFDWIMWVDPDELIYAPDIRGVLEKADCEIMPTKGWNMTGQGLPKDDGRQLWEISPFGIGAPVYSKPVVFRPTATVRWVRGKHALENCSPKVCPDSPLKLLHYRYLGYQYTKIRNARNYNRLGPNKEAGWSCAPDYTGEHSAQWAESIAKNKFNAVETLPTKTIMFETLLQKLHRGTNPYVGFPPGEWSGAWYDDPGAQREIFKTALNLASPGLVIEVGTFVGESAIFMAKHLKSKGVPATILCVDTWYAGFDHYKGAPEKIKGHFGRPDFFYRFINNVLANNCQNTILPFAMDSMNAARVLQWAGVQADMIYIDASHEEGDVLRDYEAYWAILKSGGVFMVDDLSNHFPGVLKDFDTFVKQRNLKVKLTEGEKAIIIKP